MQYSLHQRGGGSVAGDGGMRAVVRVGADGLSWGAGFLLAPDLVATCAHVVAEALDVDPGPEPPAGELEVDLPFSRGIPSRRARVERWRPPEADGGGDVALLRLDGPVTEPVPALRRLDEPWGRPFRAAGFPSGREDGVWAAGRFREEQGSGWVQLVSEDGPAVGPGFSGTPVWDADGGSVVAMAVAADRVTGGRGSAYALPVDQVLELAPEVLVNPYRGLAAFTEDDAEFFFGRDADVARCRETLDRDGLLVLAGGSGAGKSSVLLAGLAPAERARGRLVAHVRPSGAAGHDAFVGDVVAALDGVAPGDWAGFLAGSGDVPAGDGRILLVVDQMEELAAADPDRAHPALETLVTLAGAGVRVAVTFRWAGFDALPADDLAGALRRATVPLAPLDRDGLRRAVAEPARRVPGPSFEAGLVARIVDDAGDEPGRLPLVQALLAELWDERDGGLLTGAAYERAGAVQGALVRAAERVWSTLDPADRPVARAVLVELTRPAGDGFVRVPVALSDLDPERVGVLRLLADRRLVVIGSTPDSDVAELAHQALVDRWPRLRGWLAEDVAFLRWRDGLRDAVRRWGPARDPDRLLRGTDLDAALGWRRDRAADLAPDERDLVDASERRRRRNRRLRLAGVAVLVVLVLVAGTLAAVATSSNRQLTRALDAANARSLAQLAQGRLTTDPAAGTQLALAAYRSDPDDAEARSALGQAYVSRRSTTAARTVPQGPVSTMAADADVDVTVLSTPAGAVVAEGLSGPSPSMTPVPGSAGPPRRAVVGGRGRWVVLVADSGAVSVWDRSGPVPPRALDGLRDPLLSVTPDGNHLISATPVPGGTAVRVDDLAAGTATPPVTLPERDVTGIWQTADPARILVRAGEVPVDRLSLRDARSGATVTVFPERTAAAGRGALTVSCGSTPDSGSFYRTADAVTGRPGVSVPTSGFCGQAPGVTADGSHVVDDDTSARPERSNRVAIVVDLENGRTGSVWLPRIGQSDLLSDRPVASDGLAVFGDRLVLVDVGAVDTLTLSSVPDWHGHSTSADPITVYGSRDGSFAVSASASKLSATRMSDGVVLGRPRPGLIAPDESGIAVKPGIGTDTTFLITRYPGGVRVHEFALPEFRPLGTYEVTDAGAAGPAADGPANATGSPNITVTRAGDRVVVLAGGVLSWWSATTHRPVAPPVVTTSDPERAKRLSLANSRLLVDSPSGDLVALAEPDGLAVWRVGARTPMRIAPDLPGLPVVAAVHLGDGRLFTVERPGTLVERDPDDGAIVGTPVAIPPSSDGLAGLTPEGFPVTVDPLQGTIAFWDTRTGSPAGQIVVSDAGHGAAFQRITDGRFDIATDDDLTSVAVDPRVWRDHLCRAQNRPFDAAELALLPPRADTSAPCTSP